MFVCACVSSQIPPVRCRGERGAYCYGGTLAINDHYISEQPLNSPRFPPGYSTIILGREGSVNSSPALMPLSGLQIDVDGSLALETVSPSQRSCFHWPGASAPEINP